MAKNSAYSDAVTYFHRVGGQLKRNHDINPDDYLEGVTTVKGVERALKQMRFDAERIDIDAAVDEYERAYNDALEEEQAKYENTQDFINDHEAARESLNENWDLDWDETDSQIFWDAFDDADIMDAFGSNQVLDMGNTALNRNDITTKQAADIAKGLAAKLLGSGKTNEQKRDTYDDYINEYVKLRKPGGISHKQAIEELFR